MPSVDVELKQCGIFRFKGLILVDQVEMFNKTNLDLIETLAYRDDVKIVYTTQPYHCGWRTPKFVAGFHQFDDRGFMVTENTSWDYNYINWKTSTTHTRACKKDYKNDVIIITDYGIEPSINISGLLDGEYLRLQGE